MFKALIVAYGISCGADLGTTANSLEAGGREALVPSQNMAVVAAVSTSAMAASSYALVRLHRRHPRWATALTVAGIGFKGWATSRNLAVARGGAQ